MRQTPSFVRNTACLSLAILLGACVSTASTVSTEFYDVRGGTSEQIDVELRRNGPMNGHALASAAIKFEPVSIFPQMSDNGCTFRTAKFRVDANITLPRWINRSASKDRDLRRAWDGLARYAKLHEKTHVKIAENYAKLLGKALLEMPAADSCEKLDRQSVKVVTRILKDHDKAQKAFDDAEQKRLAVLFEEAERQSS